MYETTFRNPDALVLSLLCARLCMCAARDRQNGSGSQRHSFRDRRLDVAGYRRSQPGKDAFLLAVGMLEEHGPHLPIAADTIGVEYEARNGSRIV